MAFTMSRRRVTSRVTVGIASPTATSCHDNWGCTTSSMVASCSVTQSDVGLRRHHLVTASEEGGSGGDEMAHTEPSCLLLRDVHEFFHCPQPFMDENGAVVGVVDRDVDDGV